MNKFKKKLIPIKKLIFYSIKYNYLITNNLKIIYIQNKTYKK